MNNSFSSFSYWDNRTEPSVDILVGNPKEGSEERERESWANRKPSDHRYDHKARVSGGPFDSCREAGTSAFIAFYCRHEKKRTRSAAFHVKTPGQGFFRPLFSALPLFVTVSDGWNSLERLIGRAESWPPVGWLGQ